MRTVPLFLLALACAPGPVDGPDPFYDPGADALVNAPWPRDDLRHADGTLDLSKFPTKGLGLLERYIDVAATLDGWGTTAPVYFPVTELPPDGRLPSPPASVLDDSGLLLADVDPDSPTYGELVPVQWELVPAGSTLTRPVLAVAPVFGFPLRPDTTYAAVVTTQVLAPSPAFAAALETEPYLAPLADALRDLPVRASEIAVGTVFTTRDPLDDMERLVGAVRARPPQDLSQTLEADDSNPFFSRYTASATLPLWQHGERPYASEGGDFRYGADGTPELARDESVVLTVSMPNDVSDPPPGGFPVVLYAHGTGGSRNSFANNRSGLEVASGLARSGIVGISFDQPLHGTRATEDTDPERHSFNYANPVAARANFRQGALDIVALAHDLRGHDVVFTLPDGTGVPLDTEQIGFMGHSHGGLTAALALPWMGEDLNGAVLSGAGGGLAISVAFRTDPIDIATLIETILQVGPDESLTPMHPVVGLVQLLVEETDPLNYAPHWIQAPRGDATRSTPVLLTSGQFDVQTDHRTAEALAAAAGLPQVEPAWNDPVALELRGLAPVEGPVRDNLTGFDGAPRTGALSQWEEGDHFVVFRDVDAAEMVRRFLEGAAEGAPVIDPTR